jgi:predicted flap endonuclease-1-like 5' DNA nuclease
MLQMIEANWLAFILALLIGLVVAWWIFARGSSGGGPRERKPDVLDEGAAPAQRNQALIDAPSAAALADSGPDIFGGIGEIFAAAAHDEVEHAAAAKKDEAPGAPQPAGEGDDLTRIKGVGPKLVSLLNSLGVTRYEQIAGWSEEDIDRIDSQLGAFQGRARRDAWVEQARLLASGDMAAYEAKFGKL